MSPLFYIHDRTSCPARPCRVQGVSPECPQLVTAEAEWRVRSLWLQSLLPFFKGGAGSSGFFPGNTSCRPLSERTCCTEPSESSNVVWEFFYHSYGETMEDTIYGIIQYLFVELHLTNSESKAKKYFLSSRQVFILLSVHRNCGISFPFCSGCQDVKT